MRIMAWVLWVLAAIWVVMALFGAANFQELYDRKREPVRADHQFVASA